MSICNIKNEDVLGFINSKKYYNEDQIKEFLTLGALFDNTLREDAEEYRELLQRSITVLDNLKPLFTRAMKCHQSALEAFTVSNDRESALQSMKETTQLAKEIRVKYTHLATEFMALREQMVGRFLVRDTQELWTIQTNLLNLNSTWKQAGNHSEELATSDLADPDMVELFAEYKGPGEAENAFRQLLTTADAALNTPSPHAPMRTGRATLLNTPSPFLQLVFEPMDIGTQFKKSCLSWLALNKLNQTMHEAMTEALNQL